VIFMLASPALRIPMRTVQRPILLLILAVVLAAADSATRLANALAQAPRGGEAALAVFDCGKRDWLWVGGDAAPLRLASTTKLLVAAAALDELGPRFQFITRIHALGPIVGGQVPGLGVIGGGDPTFDEHFWEKDPERAFRQWADRIRAAGVTRIAGDLVIDHRLFRGPIRPPTYPTGASNLTQWYSAPASAFAFNDNCIDVRAVPTRPGEPCRIETRPSSPRITVDNRTRTAAGKGDATFQVRRAADANTLIVTGSYDRTTSWFPVAIHQDPDLLAGDHLKLVLGQSGLPVDGQVRLGAVDVKAGPLLHEARGDLLPALRLMNTHSQNFYGEQILRIIGIRRLGDGSVAGGARATALAVAGLSETDAPRLTLLDGSGLSYGNTWTARGLCSLLAAMDRHGQREAFVGSLKDRLHAGIVGKVKTGTLATASCLAGYVEGPRGRLAFAMLLGQGESGAWGWGPPLRDRLFEIIAEAVR
jgi:D-alanyl-D-alanine carboxypeptidase/D-alanyl-D-alanine-endopeptidase (penicillin-binding protein 4)